MTRESLGTPSLVKLNYVFYSTLLRVCSLKTLIFHWCKFFLRSLLLCSKYLRKLQMAMKANNVIVNWRNNIVFDGSQTRYFFHKT